MRKQFGANNACALAVTISTDLTLDGKIKVTNHLEETLGELEFENATDNNAYIIADGEFMCELEATDASGNTISLEVRVPNQRDLAIRIYRKPNGNLGVQIH